jgi:hypothetical protein
VFLQAPFAVLARRIETQMSCQGDSGAMKADVTSSVLAARVTTRSRSRSRLIISSALPWLAALPMTLAYFYVDLG